MPVNHIHVCVKKKFLPITVQTTTQKSFIVSPGTAKPIIMEFSLIKTNHQYFKLRYPKSKKKCY